MDDVRNRYLRDRVMTATPAQRVVMLFDRLVLDLHRASEADDAANSGPHLGHAASIVAELFGSLDLSAGGPAENLANIYGYLLNELTAMRTSARSASLPHLAGIVEDLRDSFAQVAAATAGVAATSALAAVASSTNPYHQMSGAVSASSWVS